MKVCKKCHLLYKAGYVAINTTVTEADICSVCKKKLASYKSFDRTIDDIVEFVKCITKVLPYSISYKENPFYDWQNRVNLLFRGQADIEYDLLPKIAREGKQKQTELFFLKKEKTIIEKAKKEMPELFLNCENSLEMLSLMQHYGLPTRLLDVTENPLVALYFACKSNSQEEQKDGEVIIFGQIKSENVSDNMLFFEKIADSYKYYPFLKFSDFYDSVVGKRNIESIEIHKKVNCEMNKKEKQKQSLEGEQKVISYLNNAIKVVEVSKFSLRQKAQQSKFILFSNRVENLLELSPQFFQKIEKIDKSHEMILGRIRITKENKQKILEQLRLLGISESVLFPDDYSRKCEDISKEFGFA